MKELISAIERTLELLEISQDSPWATDDIQEIKILLQKYAQELKENQRLGVMAKNKLKFLFLPTGSLQEISISNDWGEEYLKIAEIIDQATA